MRPGDVRYLNWNCQGYVPIHYVEEEMGLDLDLMVQPCLLLGIQVVDMNTYRNEMGSDRIPTKDIVFPPALNQALWKKINSVINLYCFKHGPVTPRMLSDRIPGLAPVVGAALAPDLKQFMGIHLTRLEVTELVIRPTDKTNLEKIHQKYEEVHMSPAEQALRLIDKMKLN